MIVLTTVNNRRFRLNGIEYLKNYITVVHGNRVEIFNCYERSDVLVPLTHYDQFTVNGAVYESAIELQSALLDVLYSRIMASTDAVFEQNNLGRRINLNAVPNDTGVPGLDFILKLNTITTIITPMQSPVIIRGYIPQENNIAKTHQFLWMGGKGTFGVGGDYVLASMLQELAPVLLEDPDSIVYNYGDLVNQTISQWLNAKLSPIYIQPQESGYFIFKGTIDSVATTYLWIGDSGEYGVDVLQSSDGDFQQLSDVPGGVITPTLQQVATEGSEAVINSDFSVATTNATFKVKDNGDMFSGGSGTASLNYTVIDLGSGQTKTSHTPSAPTDIINKTHLDARLNTKADLVNGMVPAGQLPSYVDDVLEFATLAAFPTTGESGKLYIAVNTNLVYRWGGSAYVVTSSSLALGETSVTAYRGDRGKAAYDHSLLTTGNPHGTAITDISGLQPAINAKLTGTAANDTEMQAASATEDNKFVSRLKLFNWWTWVKTQAANIAGNWNFTGTLKKSGVDVATATDVATKLNIATNTGLAGTGIRIPKVSESGTITVDAFLSWATETNQLNVGSATNPGKINVSSPIFERAVQDTIASGQSRILFNSAQEDAMSLVDKTGAVYITFRSATDGKAIILKQREIFDEQVFYPLVRRQAAISSAGAGVTVYGKDSLGNIINIPFNLEGNILFAEATLIVKNSTASQVIAAKLKAVAKRVGGVTIITTLPLEIMNNNDSYTNFTAGIVAVGNNLQFYFTPAPDDTTIYAGAFTEIKYTIN
jgi:hypothetical protein